MFQKKIPERRNSDETFINYILEAMEDVQVGEVSKEVQAVRENVGLILKNWVKYSKILSYFHSIVTFSEMILGRRCIGLRKK